MMGSSVALPVQPVAVSNLDMASQVKNVDSAQNNTEFSKYLSRELGDSKVKKVENKKTDTANVEKNEEVKKNNSDVDEAKETVQASEPEVEEKVKQSDVKIENAESAAVLLLQNILKELMKVQSQNVNDTDNKDEDVELDVKVENFNILNALNVNTDKTKINDLINLLKKLDISIDQNNNVQIKGLDALPLDSSVKDGLKDILTELVQKINTSDVLTDVFENKEMGTELQEKILNLFNDVNKQELTAQDYQQAVESLNKKLDSIKIDTANSVKTEEPAAVDITEALDKNLAQDANSEKQEQSDVSGRLAGMEPVENADKVAARGNNKFAASLEDSLKHNLQTNIVSTSEHLLKTDNVVADIKGTVGVDTKVFTSNLDVKQLASDISINFNKGNSAVNITMKPEYLGELNVKMSINADQVTLTMKTDNSVAKQALESSINQLKEALNQHGIKVASYEITTGNEMDFNNNNLNTKFEDANKGNLKQRFFDDEQDSQNSQEDAQEEHQNNFSRRKSSHAGVLDYFA